MQMRVKVGQDSEVGSIVGTCIQDGAVQSNAICLQAAVGSEDNSIAAGSLVMRSVRAVDYEAAVKIDSTVNFAASSQNQAKVTKTGMSILCHQIYNGVDICGQPG